MNSGHTGVAVVTGAAGTIGQAICEALAPEMTVVGLDRVPGPNIRVVDITDRAALTSAAQAVQEEVGPVSVLVNNAGALTMGRFLDLTDSDWRDIYGVNVFGTFLVSQVFAKQMVERASGRIVNISSVGGKVPLPDQAHYCSAKAAVIMLSRCMALELSDHGLSTYAVCPGAVDTALFRQCLNWTAERDGRDPQQLLAEWLSPSRLGRFVLPGEVAQLVRYLAVGPSEALTGHAVSVDGGVSPW